MTRYWINTVSRDHVAIGEAGGFTQANHGRPTTLKRLRKGDWIVFYSPRTEYPAGEPLRHFTAIGCVTDDDPYQAEMTPTFHPWRRRMEFVPHEDAPISNLLDDLTFIRDTRHWGFVFRRGMFEIPEGDFQRIAHAMKANAASS